jgi:subtilisin family serine protease
MIDPALLELSTREGGALLEVIAKLRGGAEPPPELRIVARMGDIVTGRLAKAMIDKVRADPSVLCLKAGRAISYDPPEAEQSDLENRVEAAEGPYRDPPPYPERGRGITLAFHDCGSDFAHPNFRNADGTTRLVAMWDQRSGSAPVASENCYGYGTFHPRGAIDAALSGPDPYASLAYDPADSDPLGTGAHGTHVMDIAAGNGRAPGSTPGPASESDLIFVHLSSSMCPGENDLGDSARLIEAMDFCLRAAIGKPLVVNMSFGSCGGSHDGNSLVEQAIDRLLETRPGMAIVQSVGNYFNYRTHASGRLKLTRPEILSWEIPEDDQTTNELEIWYSSEDRLELRLVSPSRGEAYSAILGDITDVLVDGVKVGRIYHRERDSAAFDNHLDIFLYPEAPSGQWTLELRATDLANGFYHAWIERDSGRRRSQSRFSPDCATRDCTLGTIACGRKAIAVGAYDPREEGRPIAGFSSAGPTRDNRERPDILAPGVGIVAARSAPRGMAPGSGGVTTMSGTSMASPRVAGAVALILEAVGGLPPIDEIRALLLRASDPGEGLDPERSGNGYLGIEKALAAAREYRAAQGSGIGPSAPRVESATIGSEAAGCEVNMRIDESGVEGLLDMRELFEGLATSRMTGNRRIRPEDWPALVFDRFSGLADESLDASLGNRLEVVCLPGAYWDGEAETGDLAIRRALGEGLLAKAEALDPDSPPFGIRRGYLSRDCLILRPRSLQGEGEGEGVENIEVFPMPKFETVKLIAITYYHGKEYNTRDPGHIGSMGRDPFIDTAISNTGLVCNIIIEAVLRISGLFDYPLHGFAYHGPGKGPDANWGNDVQWKDFNGKLKWDPRHIHYAWKRGKAFINARILPELADEQRNKYGELLNWASTGMTLRDDLPDEPKEGDLVITYSFPGNRIAAVRHITMVMRNDTSGNLERWGATWGSQLSGFQGGALRSYKRFATDSGPNERRCLAFVLRLPFAESK